MTQLIPVILSGGAGTRLWPASRSMYPKQLLPLAAEMTMLQETAKRLDGLSDLCGRSIVICNEAHRFLVAEQMQEIGAKARVVLEPEGRNTAPAVALAAFLALQKDEDACLLIMPADHVIADISKFHDAVRAGLASVEEGNLVTFGVVPQYPETGYGYIEATLGDSPVAPVESFVEKPDMATAQQYVSGGRHFWNSGMFLFRAADFVEELEKYAPAIHEWTQESIRTRAESPDFVRPGSEAFLQSPSDSIDYAVMERSERVTVVPLDAGWSDVGSWSALHDALQTDGNDNYIEGDVLTYACSGSIIKADDRLVAVVGLDDVIVIDTKDATLVASKARSQDVKAIVEQLNQGGRSESELHRQVFRPWGSYDSLENKDGFQVKRLIVNPGAVLSLQKHAHRAEHWVCVRGTARVTLDDDEFDLNVNESTHVPVGAVHRIANTSTEPVHIIEVQCGDYLGEDDIVRLEDNYGREGTNT